MNERLQWTHGMQGGVMETQEVTTYRTSVIGEKGTDTNQIMTIPLAEAVMVHPGSSIVHSTADVEGEVLKLKKKLPAAADVLPEEVRVIL